MQAHDADGRIVPADLGGVLFGEMFVEQNLSWQAGRSVGKPCTIWRREV